MAKLPKNPTNRELLIILENLGETMSKGFKGIHDRQDETNGKVEKNSEFRIESKAQIRVWQVVIGVLGLSNLGFIATAIYQQYGLGV